MSVSTMSLGISSLGDDHVEFLGSLILFSNKEEFPSATNIALAQSTTKFSIEIMYFSCWKNIEAGVQNDEEMKKLIRKIESAQIFNIEVINLSEISSNNVSISKPRPNSSQGVFVA